ncbi:hypothetical protein H0H87_007471 [Tephrocybe sp. NHM501043]|nr:hypothetical protein H0H87_007471 [Tephrocybe sp. NHM501043]
MQTCRAINSCLLPENNPSLFGAIYRHKFDTDAVIRRAFEPTAAQYTAQLLRVLAAMRLLRSQNVNAPEDDSRDWDLDLSEALHVAFIMLLEDDGRNAAQLVLWAKADVLVKRLVMRRLFDGSRGNSGFPIEGSLVSRALWVWWLLTSEESLLKEAPEERLKIQNLLLAFVYHPVRYAVTFAPPNHFILPPKGSIVTDTVHGQYPIYHHDSSINTIYFGARSVFADPPASVAAKLLFLARFEVTPIPTAKRLYSMQAELEEFNWGWSVHLPLGTGERTRSGAPKIIEGWDGREWTQEDHRDELAEPYPHRPPVVTPLGIEPPSPIPRWDGKAPHPKAGVSKSRNFDSDWWRMRMCGFAHINAPRVPYGNTYEPGSIDGLWQGSMLLPAIEYLRELIQNPLHPQLADFVENTRQSEGQQIFVRLRELHSVEGEIFPDHSGQPSTGTNTDDDQANQAISNSHFGLGSLEEHYGMMNGWFTGNQRPLILPDSLDIVRVQVGDETAIYHSQPQYDARRFGNDAYTSADLATGEEQSLRVEEDSRKIQYEHDPSACAKCRDRRHFRRLLRLVRNSNSVEDHDFDSDEEDLLSPWDKDDSLFRPYLDSQGHPLAPEPSAHNWDRRGQGQCDGIRDIIVVGEPDTPHARAFGAYFYYGRVRRWDGAIVLVRVGKDNPDLGIMVFYGNIVGGHTFVGKWRWGGTDPGEPNLEGPFCLGRRLD